MSELDLSTIECNAVVLYAQRCLDVLQLKQWAVLLAAEPTSHEDAHASIKPSDGRYLAMVYLSTDWASYDETLKRNVIMHECIHLTHAQLDDHMRNVLENNTQISADLWHAVYTPFIKNCEYMADNWTTAIRMAGILPEWPTKAETRAFMKRHGIVDGDDGPQM